MPVKNRLKEIIDNKGIKKSWLAEQIGVTKSTISTLVQNKYSTSIDIAFKLANVLDMDITDIFYEEKENIGRPRLVKIAEKITKD
jgi:DNA-binding XRE family transcriptional regulator